MSDVSVQNGHFWQFSSQFWHQKMEKYLLKHQFIFQVYYTLWCSICVYSFSLFVPIVPLVWHTAITANINEKIRFFFFSKPMEAVPLKRSLFLLLHWRCKVLSDAALEAPEPLRCSSGATAQLRLPATGAGLEHGVLIYVIKEPVMNGSSQCLAVLCSWLGCWKWFTDSVILPIISFVSLGFVAEVIADIQSSVFGLWGFLGEPAGCLLGFAAAEQLHLTRLCHALVKSPWWILCTSSLSVQKKIYGGGEVRLF